MNSFGMVEYYNYWKMMVLFRAIDLFLKIINLVLILFFLKKMKYVGKKKEFKVQNVNGLNKKKIIELGSLEKITWMIWIKKN